MLPSTGSGKFSTALGIASLEGSKGSAVRVVAPLEAGGKRGAVGAGHGKPNSAAVVPASSKIRQAQPDPSVRVDRYLHHSLIGMGNLQFTTTQYTNSPKVIAS